jgi:hypothetical protein
MHADTRPAWLLLPVSAFTQIPATSVMALLPTNETASPVR